MSDNNDVIVFAHRLKFKNEFKKGGIDLFLDHIQKYYIFEYGFKDIHSFDNKKVVISKIEKSKKTVLKIYNYKFNNFFLQVLESIFLTINIIKNYNFIKPIFIYNNFLAGTFYLFVKLIFFKNSKSYFHMTDYVERVFVNNTILRIVIKYSNYIGVMTNRAKKKIIDKYKINKKKIFIINNSIKSQKKIKNKKKLIFVTGAGSVIDKYRYNEILNFCEKLKLKKKVFKLFIFGSKYGDIQYYKKLKNLVKKNNLNKYIFFSGFEKIENYNKFLKQFATVGIALYSNNKDFNWMHYADPLKIREYIANKIFFICDKTTEVGSLAIKKGVALNFSKKEEFVDKFLNKINSQTKINKLNTDLSKFNSYGVKKRNIEKMLKNLKY